jgi:hypothetical protein
MLYVPYAHSPQRSTQAAAWQQGTKVSGHRDREGTSWGRVLHSPARPRSKQCVTSSSPNTCAPPGRTFQILHSFRHRAFRQRTLDAPCRVLRASPHLQPAHSISISFYFHLSLLLIWCCPTCVAHTLIFLAAPAAHSGVTRGGPQLLQHHQGPRKELLKMSGPDRSKVH